MRTFHSHQFNTAPPRDVRSTCSLCGLPNKCGIELGKGTCWCFSYPALGPLASIDQDKCICESCLQKKLQKDNI
jgi:hypothetical protein